MTVLDQLAPEVDIDAALGTFWRIRDIRRRRRRVARLGAATLTVVALIGAALLVAHQVDSHQDRGVVSAPSQTAPSTSVPAVRCSHPGTLTAVQRRVCRREGLGPLAPSTSDLGSGADGNPTRAQAARLATEVKEYDPAVVQAMIAQGEAHGQRPDDQAIVAALEYQNACIQTKRAATAAESAPPDQVAAVVNAIINPEIARLVQRTPSGSTGYEMFQQIAQRIIAGHASQVLQEMGKSICNYMSLSGPKLPGS